MASRGKTGNASRWASRVLFTSMTVFEAGMVLVCIDEGYWLWPGLPNVVLLAIALSLAVDAWGPSDA